jgi:hypothetical protein
MPLRQAAAVLGVSESAIRKRVERGTLRSDKGPDGRRYVYLDVPEPGADTVADEVADMSATVERDALTSEREDRVADLHAHIADLRGQLEAERTAHEQTRRLLGGALERIPQLEAPREPTGGPETVEKGPERAEPQSDAPVPQAATQRPQGGGLRGLRRRILGW